jgi:tetratricopeptide (TPR) repeat protein
VADKARLSRKEAKQELKQPDEFITLTGQAVTWSRGHQQLVIGIGVAAAVLIAALGIGTAYRAAQRRDANADLTRALAKVEVSDYAGAVTELTAVSERWSGTEIGPLAKLMAADSALRAGETDQAISLLGQLQPGTLPSFLQQQVLVVWGNALERKQQWAEAAAKYKDAAAISGPYTGPAVVGEARSLEQAGDADKARDLYRQAYEQFPDLPGRELLATKFPPST